MERIRSLNNYQKGILIVMAAMSLMFAVIYPKTIARVGYKYNDVVIAIITWIEEQTPISVAVGLILMAVGCMVFVIGQYVGENKKKASFTFWLVNIWFITLIPLSCVFSCIQGVIGRFWWTFTPTPQLGNSLGADKEIRNKIEEVQQLIKNAPGNKGGAEMIKSKGE